MANQDNAPTAHGVLRFGPPQRLGYWGEHPDFTEEDWKYEVACGDTREGYWDWVHDQLEALKEQGNMESERQSG